MTTAKRTSPSSPTLRLRRVGLSLGAAALLGAPAAFAQSPELDDPFAQPAATAPAAPSAARPGPRVRAGTPAAAPVGRPPAPFATPAPPSGPAQPAMPAAVAPPVPRAPQIDERRAPQLFEPEGPVTSWDPQRFAVALEGRATWPVEDTAKRLASEKWPAGGGVSVQADVFRPSDQLAVRLDLGWTNTRNSSYQSGSYQYGYSLEERLETNLVQVGASLRYHLFRWLAPYARLSGGLGWDKLTVGAMSDRQSFQQVAAGAGIFLRTPGIRLWQGRFSPLLGLVGSLEAGYALATGSDFSVRASLPTSSEDPIPTNRVALGHVGRSAPYARATLGLAF